MEINEYKKDDKYVINVKGDVDVYTMETLKASVTTALNSDTKQFLVDLEECSYIDSSGIGVLITALKQFTQKGGEFLLCDVSAPIMKIFKLSRLDQLFDFCTKKDLGLE